jgi:hypothetical protein
MSASAATATQARNVNSGPLEQELETRPQQTVEARRPRLERLEHRLDVATLEADAPQPLREPGMA